MRAWRDTFGDEQNPFTFEEVRERIDAALFDHRGEYHVIRLPNIVNVMYGRDVGYKVTRIELDPETEAISATEIRKREGL